MPTDCTFDPGPAAVHGRDGAVDGKGRLHGNPRPDRRRRDTMRDPGDDVTDDTRPGHSIHLKSARHADGGPPDRAMFPVAWRAS